MRATSIIRRRVLILAIVLVLLFFGSMPILIVVYGGIAQALFGLTIIGCLALVQIPLLFLLKRFWPMPVQFHDVEPKSSAELD